MSQVDAIAVLQSGGPSSTVNASLAGVLEEARARGLRVIGVRGGLAGLSDGIAQPIDPDLVDLDELADEPGCALVSSRRPFDEDSQRTALDNLDSWRAALVVIGGDGSMNATSTLVEAGIAIAGIVNTCDNDLADFSYSPGFPTAGSRLAQWAVDARSDCNSLGGFDDVAVLETMGRDVGWLAAASGALAGADLIVIPERPRDAEAIVQDIAELANTGRRPLVVLAEGAVETGYTLLAERAGSVPQDSLGRPIVSLSNGPGMALAALLRELAGLQARVARPGVLQRSGAPLSHDRDVARELGSHAVTLALDGQSGSAVGPGATVPFERLRGRALPDALLTERGAAHTEVLRALGNLFSPPRASRHGLEQQSAT